MNSPCIGLVEQNGEMSQWGMQAAPMYQAPQDMSPNNFNHAKHNDWGTSADYSEPRRNTTRSKPQWGGVRRQQQQHQQQQQQRPALAAAAPLQWQQPPQPPPPTTSPGAFQETQGPSVVNLQGLPQALCSQQFLETMLEQAGLMDNITGVVLGQKQDTGKALIYLNNRNAAQMCIEHFSGCCWDKNGARITAQVIQEEVHQSTQAPQNHSNGMMAEPTQQRNTEIDLCKGAKARTQRTKLNHEALPFIQNEHLMMCMPQPIAALPFSPVCSYQFTTQMSAGSTVTGYSDEGSTVTGDSSGRCDSWESGNADGGSADFACDTDDGF